MAPDDSYTPPRAIVGGTVVDPSTSKHEQLNVFIENGSIVELSNRVPDGDEGVIDASGCIVAPGFIDMHVHLREPGQEHKEDITTGSRAAAAGGFTTICPMPNTKPVSDSAESLRYVIERAEEVSAIQVLPVGALSEGSKGARPADYEAMRDAGACAFSDDGCCIQDRKLMKVAMALARNAGRIVIDHAEDFSEGIKRESENSIIDRDIELARETGAHVHIAHVSTAEGVKAIREAKADGISVTCEVTPHHLLLKEVDVEAYGPNAIMKPPLRSEADRRALIEGLADGTIDAIATDHAPHAAEEKRDIESAAFGVIGMETMLPVCLKLVHNDLITMDRFVDAVSCAPARILSLAGKGTLAKGTDADITIFAPGDEITIDAKAFRSKARNTPFDGWKCKGRVRYTIAGGRTAYISR
jgi:dihydroorotase